MLFQQFFHVFLPAFGQGNVFMLFFAFVIFFFEFGNDPVDLAVEFRRSLGRAGDDQRSPRFVDQDRVHLVHNRVVEVPLDHLVEAEFHIVAQVIKAEFVIGAVSDIACVCFPPFVIAQVSDDASGSEAQKFVDLSHPFRVPAGEVIVDGYDVDPFAANGVQINRQGCDEGFSFPRSHFGDLSFVQSQAPDQLNIVMALSQSPLGGFPDDGEGFVEHVGLRFPFFKAFTEYLGLSAQIFIAHRLELWFQSVNLGHMASQVL